MKCSLHAFLSAYLVILLFSAPTHAGERFRFSPLNPEFPKDSGLLLPRTESGRVLGHRPAPLDLSHLRDLRGLHLTNRKQFPAQFDLRDSGKVTPVRDQGDCGSCWTFAAFASLESCLIPEVADPDFAEEHLNSNHGFDWWPCMGGTYAMAAAYLLRWDGPLNEEDDPYPHKTQAKDMTAKRHVQDVLFLADRNGPLDNDYIKEVVMTYGVVHTTVIWSDSNFNSDTSAYYSTSTGTGNHDIGIVGWDDSYSRNNFNRTPSGDGAFICKNSWGLDFGMDGYFYYSYYDGCLGDNTAYITAEPVDNYSNLYQYDPLGWVRSLGADGLHDIEPKSTETHWGANVFTAVSEEPLAAVGFYTTSWNSSYQIYLYTGVTGDPSSGTLAGQVSGSQVYPGFHTIPVRDQGITLGAGEKFAVAIEFTTPGYDYPVPVETRVLFYSGDAESNPGESYIRATESDPWTDLTSVEERANVCIKAYTGGQDCSDGDPCTEDHFDGQDCVHIQIDCDDGNDCTSEHCDATAGCVYETLGDCITCGDAGACLDGVCVEDTGDGVPCDDLDACTQVDLCQDNACVGTDPVLCAALDECHDAGQCDPATGNCSNPEKPDGSACPTEDACYQGTCQAGVCTGSNPVVCEALDECHDAGTCDPATGLCSNPEKPDGTACDDNDACTHSDGCQSGICTGVDPVECHALDECHDAGTCDPLTGTCSDPAKPDGTPCTDGTCQSGECVPDEDTSSGCSCGADRSMRLFGLLPLILIALAARRRDRALT